MPYKLNIPAHLVEFKDGGLSFKNTIENIKTRSVLILGKSIDGPLDPVATDPTTVSKIYGKDVDEYGNPNGGNITTYVNDLYRAGCRDIRVKKITGSVAKTTVSGPVKNVSNYVKKEIELGYVEGNEATEIILNNENIIEDSIVVYIKDRLLATNFEFDSSKKQITIPAGVADCNAPITVKYSYEKELTDQPFEETLVVETNRTVTLDKTPSKNEVKVYLNDVLVSTEEYTLSDKTITFNEKAIVESRKKAVLKAAEGLVKPGDIVTVEYLSTIKVVENASDSSHDGQAYLTKTGIQVINLTETIKKDSIILYADGKEISKKHYAVSTDKISIKKDLLTVGSALVCTYLVNENKDNTSTILFESFFASNIYNEGSIEIEEIKNNAGVLIGKRVVINKPESKMATGEKPLTYSSLTYPTFGSLIQAINLDLRNGIYKASTDFQDELTSTLTVGKYQFAHGDSGINATPDEVKEALSGKRDDEGYLLEYGAYQLLESYNVDYIVLTSVYADTVVTKNEGFDYDLAMHCAMVSRKNKTTYGIIALEPCRNTSLRGKMEYVEKNKNFNADGTRFLLKEDGKVIKNSDGKPVDLGMYIRTVVGPGVYYLNDDLGKHATNPAIAYAGLACSLRPQSSPMNKPLTYSKGLEFTFNESQVKDLTRANLITFVTKNTPNGDLREEAYVFDSMTNALPDSDYVRTTNCEVVKLAADDVKEIADPYIGEPPTIESRNSFAAALSKRFSQRKQEGAFTDIGFEIIETAQDMLMGDSNVILSVIPPGERRTITTSVGLKPQI